ncbi:HAD hydrolase-like protein [Nonomuraea sp. PA05]|uniref:HAD family hydrolase n=1 Tax=Nonomuraea sp. PA05 TaxID=2604466 RepID=UPI0011D2FFD7|nr:HAD family hydrolase [Nonomuraea sp. PA05]TYB60175.1 HAD hydrolase-like protein [Nonomuraea sp. PA05]
MAVIDLHRIAAVIFETDGVLTDTARVHAAVWKRVLDAYLRRHAERSGTSWRPFEIREDYLRHVDGKPRVDGARGFLASRGIVLDVEEDRDVLAGMACLKDGLFLAEIRHYGVAPFPPAVALLHDLRHHGALTGAVSPSRNCAEILHRAGLSGMIDVRVDGVSAAESGLAPMPDPAMLLEIARRLDVQPYETAVIASTTPALRAAVKGHFGLVIALGGPSPADVECTETVNDLSAVLVTGRVPLFAHTVHP